MTSNTNARNEDQNMLITEHSVTTTATPERIWEFWSDVETWHTWDRGLDSADIDGPFAAGTKGWLKPQKGPKVKLVLNEVRSNEFFHDTTHMPLAQIDFFHSMERADDITTLTQRIEMTGPTTFLFSRIVGAGLKKDLPSVMQELVRTAESQ